MGSREELIQRSIPFLREVKDMTPGAKMERWLNETYGESSALYQDLARLIKIGVEEGRAANQEVDGPNYQTSRILEPSPETFQFSITAVYMSNANPRRLKDEDDHDVLHGQYHGHPYGELNLVVPLNKGSAITPQTVRSGSCRVALLRDRAIPAQEPQRHLKLTARRLRRRSPISGAVLALSAAERDSFSSAMDSFSAAIRSRGRLKLSV